MYSAGVILLDSADCLTSSHSGSEKRMPRFLRVSPCCGSPAVPDVRCVNGGENPSHGAEQKTATAGVGVKWFERVGNRLGVPGAVTTNFD